VAFADCLSFTCIWPNLARKYTNQTWIKSQVRNKDEHHKKLICCRAFSATITLGKCHIRSQQNFILFSDFWSLVENW